MTAWFVSSSVLILAIAGLRQVMRGRVSLRLQYALWFLVLLRLLIPVGIGASRFSVVNLVPEAATVVAPTPNPELPALPATDPSQIETLAPTTPGGSLPTPPLSPTEPAEIPQTGAEEPPALPRYGLLTTIWLLGTALTGAMFLGFNILFSLKLRRSRVPVTVENSRLPVYQSAIVKTPCLYGLFRPAIYLTGAAKQDPATLRYVLEHETNHYRHGDHLWSFLRAVALTLHWYNPLAWLAGVLSQRDAELACDEATIQRLGEQERTAYGRAIIGLTCEEGLRPERLLSTATTMVGSKESIKERIRLLAKAPQAAAAAVTALLLVAALVAGCTFTGPGKKPGDGVILYEREGLMIAIPEGYADRLLIDPTPSEDSRRLLSVYEKASYEVEAGAGWLFDISRYSVADYEQAAGGEMSGKDFFARDEAHYFGYFFPTDVQARGDEMAYREVAEALANFVRDDVRERNGLAAYDHYSFINEATTWGGEHLEVEYYPYYEVTGSKDVVYTLTMSQPVRSGVGGIWCVDRWRIAEPAQVYAWFPYSGLPAADYYADLQEKADAGEGTALVYLDPLGAAQEFVRKAFQHEGRGPGSFVLVGENGKLPPVVVEDYRDIRFAASDGDVAARTFIRKEYGGFLLNLPREHPAAVSRYYLVEFSLDEVSPTAASGQFYVWVEPRDLAHYVERQGAAVGNGVFRGMVFLRQDFALSRGENGLWFCSGLESAKEAKHGRVSEAYERANEAWGWFELSALPTTGPMVEMDGIHYGRVVHEDFGTYAELEGYLKSLFSDDLVAKLLDPEKGGKLYRDIEGVLYGTAGDRGGNIYVGASDREIIPLDEGKTLVRVTATILGDDLATVVRYETHDFFFEKVGGKWVFTNFYLYY